MIHWPLTDTYVLIAAILALTLLMLITLPLEKGRVTRREFVRLQEDINRLSQDLKTLQTGLLKLCIVKREPSAEHDKTSIAMPPLRSVQTGRSVKRP
jgi:hypothetical protein